MHSASSAVAGGHIVIGHRYSILAWPPEIHSSWAPAVSARRIPSDQTAVEMGVTQVKWLYQQRATVMRQVYHLVTADGHYGNHHFWGPLRTVPCGKLVRLRQDRVPVWRPRPL